eukprot:5807692-Pyramimonas_sp.AAC.1
MVSPPVWVGAAGIHVVRSLMGSNSSSVCSRNLEPRSSPLKRVGRISRTLKALASEPLWPCQTSFRPR